MAFNELLIEFIQWRAIENLASIGIGGLAIFLGYFLFKQGINPPQTGSGKVGDYEIRLINVGPGIIFALYGALLVGYITYDHPTLERIQNIKPISSVDTSGEQPINTDHIIAGFNEKEKDDLHLIAPAINKLHEELPDITSKLTVKNVNKDDIENIISSLYKVSTTLDMYLDNKIYYLTTPEVHKACKDKTQLPKNVHEDICNMIKELKETKL